MEFSGTMCAREFHIKRSRIAEHQIVRVLKEAEAGVPLVDLSRQYGLSKSSSYKWRAKYGGMDAAALKRLKQLEVENCKLKQMYAELSLDYEILKDIVGKKS